MVEELFVSFIDNGVVCTMPSSQHMPGLPRRGPSDGYLRPEADQAILALREDPGPEGEVW